MKDKGYVLIGILVWTSIFIAAVVKAGIFVM